MILQMKDTYSANLTFRTHNYKIKQDYLKDIDLAPLIYVQKLKLGGSKCVPWEVQRCWIAEEWEAQQETVLRPLGLGFVQGVGDTNLPLCKPL